MPISFKCPKCDKQYRLNDEMAGKLARCTCGAQLKIPQPGGSPDAGDAGGDDQLGSFLDDALTPSPAQGGAAPGTGDPSSPAAGGPFGAQTPGPSFPSGSAGGQSNPYMAPSSPYQYSAKPTHSAGDPNKLPVFCLVIFIIDTVFCTLRLGLGCLGTVGLVFLAGAGNQPNMPNMPQMPQIGALEVAGVLVVLGIGIIGIIANVLFFVKKPAAVFFAVATLVLVAGAFIVEIIGFVKVGNMPAGMANQQAAIQAGIAGRIVCSIILPLIINGLYIAAVIKFVKWSKG